MNCRAYSRLATAFLTLMVVCLPSGAAFTAVCVVEKPSVRIGETIRVNVIRSPSSNGPIRWAVSGGHLEDQGATALWTLSDVPFGPKEVSAQWTEDGSIATCAARLVVADEVAEKGRLARRLLQRGTNETEGYGAYSYVLLAIAPPDETTRDRYLKILEAWRALVPSTTDMEQYFAKHLLNITYVPVAQAPPDPLTAQWLLGHYDYARATLIVGKLHLGAGHGPFLVTSTVSLTRHASPNGETLVQDLSSVPPSVGGYWVEQFIRQASQDQFWVGEPAPALRLGASHAVGGSRIGSRICSNPNRRGPKTYRLEIADMNGRTLAATLLFITCLSSQKVSAQPLQGFAVSQSGRFMAIVRSGLGPSPDLSVIDANTNRQVWGQPEAVQCMLFLGDTELITANAQGVVKIWEATHGSVIKTWTPTVPDVLDVCAIDPKLRFLANVRTHFNPNLIQILDFTTGKVLRDVERLTSRIFTLAFSPDGEWLASGELDHRARLWRPETGMEYLSYSGHATWVGALAFSEDSRCLVTSSYRALELWETTTGRSLQHASLPNDLPIQIAYVSGTAVSAPSQTAPIRMRCGPLRRSSADPALHVFVVGISNYVESTWRLSSARKDAEEIASIFDRSAESVYSYRPIRKLLDRVATLSRIQSELEQLGSMTRPGDVVLVYLSGHGIELNGEFYFLGSEMPAEVNSDTLREYAVSGSELARVLSQFRAQRFVVILDACQSASGISRLRIVLSRSHKSYHLLASSQGTSLEAARTGHGVLTSALKEVLRFRPAGTEARQYDAGAVLGQVRDLVPKLLKSLVPAAQQVVVLVDKGESFPLLRQ